MLASEGKFAVWVPNKYCNYEFPLHEELTVPPNEGSFSESDCTNFCKKKS